MKTEYASVPDRFSDIGVPFESIGFDTCSGFKVNGRFPSPEKVAAEMLKEGLLKIENTPAQIVNGHHINPETAIQDSSTTHLGRHHIQTGLLLMELGRRLNIPDDLLETIIKTGILHDFGKLAMIPLTEKPVLTPEERTIIRTHTTIGSLLAPDIMTQYALKTREAIGTVTMGHHERLNGKGYPKGKSGDQIGFAERIIAVSDVISALNSKRCYKDKFPVSRIIRHLESMIENGELGREITRVAIDLLQELNTPEVGTGNYLFIDTARA